MTDYSPHAQRNKFKPCADVTDITVHMNVTVLRNINTASQTFECTLVLYFEWNERETTQWVPDIAFTNLVGRFQTHHSELSSFTDTKNQNVRKVMSLIISGVFAEYFELQQFPMDSQKLHILMTLLNCPTRNYNNNNTISTFERQSRITNTNNNSFRQYIDRFHLKHGRCQLYMQYFMEIDSWQVMDSLKIRRTKTIDVFSLDGVTFCKAVAFITVDRRPAFYFWNIVFPVSMEVTLAFVTVFTPFDDISNKATISLTIILTIFAVKFASTQYLPATNCLTYLDKYFVFCSFFVCLIMFQNLLVYKIDTTTDYDAYFVNALTSAILAFIWIIPHIVIVPTCLVSCIRSRIIKKKLEEEDDIAESVVSMSTVNSLRLTPSLFLPPPTFNGLNNDRDVNDNNMNSINDHNGININDFNNNVRNSRTHCVIQTSNPIFAAMFGSQTKEIQSFCDDD